MVVTADSFPGGSRHGRLVTTLEKPIHHLKDLEPILQTPCLQGSLASSQLPSAGGRGNEIHPLGEAGSCGDPSCGLALQRLPL